MQQLTPISIEKFSTKAWIQTSNYSFASKYNFLPVVSDELRKLVPAMPLGFIKVGDTCQLVAIASIKANTNLYVAPDGSWLGSYTPAVLRGYPFQLAKIQDKDESILCVNEDSDQIVESSYGNPFFDENGILTQEVKDIMNFLVEVERNNIVTQLAVDAIYAAGLIVPWQLNINIDDKITSVEGLFCIDEAALNALCDEDFLTIRKNGALPIVYSQLLSMNQLSVFANLIKIQSNIKAKATTKPTHKVTSSFDTKGFSLSSDEGSIKFS